MRMLRLSKRIALGASLVLGFIGFSFAWDVGSAFAEATPPELPRVFIDTTMPDTSSYAVIHVGADGDLQSAIDHAGCGTVIKLEAGATYAGNFILKDKGDCNGRWIVISTNEEDQLPPQGTRIRPSDTIHMAKLIDPNVLSPVLQSEGSANHYRIVGIEITSTLTTIDKIHFNLVYFGNDKAFTEDHLPHHIYLDRVYIHGTPTGNTGRGLAPQGNSMAIVDSHISDIHLVGFEIQAIAIWEGFGPFKIVNNYLEASGINILFGGAQGTVPDMVPSDIEIKQNHFFKPLSWRVGDPTYAGIHWTVKNLFEVKNGQRMLVEGNIFENSWADAQTGPGTGFSPRYLSSGPAAVVQDVTFRNNIIKHNSMAIDLASDPNLPGVIRTRRVLVENNICEDISGVNWGTSLGVSFGLVGVDDAVFDHNTCFSSSLAMLIEGENPKSNNFTYTNNIDFHNVYGIVGSGTGIGLATLNRFTSDYTFARNVLIFNVNYLSDPKYYWYTQEWVASQYPPDNYFPMSVAEVGFTSYNDGMGGDYTLLSSSPYKKVGTDGKDIGAPVPEIFFATRGVVTGIWEPDVTAPSKPLSLQATAISSSQIHLSWTPSTDNFTVAGYRIYRDGKEAGTATEAPYEDTGLVPKKAYRYQVAAYDAAGNISAKSKAISKITQPLPSTKFGAGDRVRTTAKIPIRSTPSSKGAVAGTQQKGVVGTVIGGPSYENGTWWWHVNFDSDPDGWATGTRLKKE